MYTILLPCLNEEKTLGLRIENISKYLYECNLGVEILVVDNGSTDNTSAIALRNGARVVYEKNKGYGNAIRTGIGLN